MTRVACLILLACLSGNAAHAYDLETARANMAQELITCMSYYNYWSKVNRNDGVDSTRFDDSARTALNLAQLYVSEMKKLEAMAELSARTVNKINAEEGSTRLVLTYGDTCKSMLEKPTDRMQYWLDKR